MKTIYKIARTELQTLFYSPVAWLILVIFSFQGCMAFGQYLVQIAQGQTMGYSLPPLTPILFASSQYSIFADIQGYLYLYIPLLTMGLMSRELGSGSIKLLYSSPVTNTQIILGKFLSMMIYGLALIGVLVLMIIFSAIVVKDFDLPAVLSGLLGLYLLICAYAAIGLFMSSLTSYQVVAAVLTLAMLAVLNFVKDMWQGVALVREITYWLSISGRCNEFVNGLICSEDVLYFIIVVAMFLALAVVRMQSVRQKSPWVSTIGKYFSVLFLAMLLGYLSSRPSLMTYYDATATKTNTLTPNSQDVIKRLEGGMTITTYVNVLDEKDVWTALPDRVKYDEQRFRHYLRFKPDIKMKYVYYYDTVVNPEMDKRFPGKNTEQRAKEYMRIFGLDSNLFITPEQIKKQIDLSGEGNLFVRVLERESGEKTFLRTFNDMMHHPGETEITAAFKRLAMRLPKVGFLTGHGERNIRQDGDRNYSAFTKDKKFRYALMNQGFDVAEVSLEREVPEDVNIIVVAEMRSPFTPEEQVNWDKYVARGGNLLILSEPKRGDVMSPILESFGVKLVPGVLVRATENYAPELIQAYPTEEAGELVYHFADMRKYESVVTMPNVSGLEYTTGKGFKVSPLFRTDSLVWNELQTVNFVDDTVTLDSGSGEVQKSYVTTVALTREVAGREQKIMIFGDADCISNGELSTGRKGIKASNFSVIMGTFYWMSDEEVPIDVRRPEPTDTDFYLGQTGADVWKIVFMWVLPVLMVLCGLYIWLRRRGR